MAEDQNQQNQSVKGLSNILDALLAKGLINSEQFNAVKFESVNNGQGLEEVLTSKGMVSESDIARTYSEMQGIPFVDLQNISIPQDVLQKLKQDIAKENNAVIFEEVNDKFKVAMKDPLDLQKVKYMQSILGKPIEAYYADPTEITKVIDTRYGAQLGNEVDQALEQVSDNKTARNYNTANFESDEDLGSAPIIRIVNMIMEYAIKNDASDVHIEPRETKISVRFRIRGVLSEKLTIPQKLLSAVVTRIKILSNLKIDEHRIPQDGRFQVKNGDNMVDIRVSIMPSIHGEKVVMRIQENAAGIMDIEDTGIRGISLARLRDALSRTQGVVLVTGPTGSGKTQTLASSLKILNSPQVNIITLEDPVEIKIEGVNQTQVNPEVGLTFANGLRSILRQDPDVIMVGEIRDAETATLAIQAALVGRLVLTTVHTNSAAGAFIRLIDMGIEPFLLTSTVNVVVAQRLVRVLCECKEEYEATAEELEELHKELDPLHGIRIVNKKKNINVHFDENTKSVTLYKAKGCPKCNGTGYVSRTGIFEVLKMSDQMSSIVMKKTSIRDINTQAIKEGMITLIQDGFIKSLEGTTTLQEVLRVKNE